MLWKFLLRGNESGGAACRVSVHELIVASSLQLSLPLPQNLSISVP